ncbi:MAG: bacillithiol biosynthesis deacetylase BshB1 [Planctomycetes bacterium]|nr:bacillithiol biosynthesis deacetylase BshB1 [Planctomycetota bacterium]
MTVDVLVLAAHPDDAEIGCGGTIVDLVSRGARVAIVDMSRGEKGTLGTPEIRAGEAAAAANVLGVAERIDLGLPDAELRDDARALNAVVEQIRRLRPALMLGPTTVDIHPDHAETGRVARRAFFHAGLANFEPGLGPAHRPARVMFYAGNDLIQPTVCVDISAHVAKKRAALECYASQVTGSDAHRVRKLDVLERAEARDRYFGSLSGCQAAEPFVADGGLSLPSLISLLPDRS